METTEHGLKKPSDEDFYNVQDFNDNADIIETHLSDTKVHVNAEEIADISEPAELTQINNTDTNNTLWGKVKKTISVLIDHISKVANSATLGHIKIGAGLAMSSGTASVKLANNLTTADTTTALTAAMGKQLNDTLTNSLNGLKIFGGKTALYFQTVGQLGLSAAIDLTYLNINEIISVTATINYSLDTADKITKTNKIVTDLDTLNSAKRLHIYAYGHEYVGTDELRVSYQILYK